MHRRVPPPLDVFDCPVRHELSTGDANHPRHLIASTFISSSLGLEALAPCGSRLTSTPNRIRITRALDSNLRLYAITVRNFTAAKKDRRQNYHQQTGYNF